MSFFKCYGKHSAVVSNSRLWNVFSISINPSLHPSASKCAAGEFVRCKCSIDLCQTSSFSKSGWQIAATRLDPTRKPGAWLFTIIVGSIARQN